MQRFDSLSPDDVCLSETINTAAFSIAMNRSEARLFVTWKDKLEEGLFHMKRRQDL